MLDLAILGALQEQDLHGYELRKRIADPIGPLPHVSFGSLYPALARLEARGAVRVPCPTSRSRTRDRVVYSITPVGQALFTTLLADPPAPHDADRGFNIRLAFARHLSNHDRRRLLERRREQLLLRSAQVQAAMGQAAAADTYARALADHRLDATERELLWVEQLLVTETTPPPLASLPSR